MTATYTEARDEMFGMFTDAFLAGAPAIAGETVEIRYQGVNNATLPSVNKYWVRLSTKNVLGAQTAFVSPDAPGQSAKEYTSEGLIFVELFGPMTKADAFDRLGKLAELAQGIFQSAETSSSVWFRRVRINDLPDDGKAWRFNVVAEYKFDTLNG
jgi:hypothetical protein